MCAMVDYFSQHSQLSRKFEGKVSMELKSCDRIYCRAAN